MSGQRDQPSTTELLENPDFKMALKRRVLDSPNRREHVLLVVPNGMALEF